MVRPKLANECGDMAMTSQPMSSSYGIAKDQEYLWRPVKTLLSGAVAGAVSRTLTAPIDRVKMLMQIDQGRRPATLPEVINSIRAEGTIRAFFRGNGVNVLKIAPETAIKLTMNDKFKDFLSQGEKEITLTRRFYAGALAGLCGQMAIYPLEVVRTQMCVNRHNTYSGILDATRKIYAHGGSRAFYRGVVPASLGILPYAGVDIMVFEMLRERLYARHDNRPPPHMMLAAGMVSSCTAQTISYPLALIRTRLQAQGSAVQPVRYNGMGDAIVRTFRSEGLRGFYKGLVPNMVKVAPAAGITWLVFEECKHWLGMNKHI